MQVLPTDIAGIELTDARTGIPNTIAAMTTLFDLVLIVIDRDQPLPAAVRRSLTELNRVMTGADTTVAVLVVGADPHDALDVAAEAAGRCRVFTDPDGRSAQSLGISATPGLVWISTEPALLAVESGFDRGRWTDVLKRMAQRWAWTRPLLPTVVPGVSEPLRTGLRSDPELQEVTDHDPAA
jgi:hypothetical protein